MLRTNTADPPCKLIEYLQSNSSPDFPYRKRAVLVRQAEAAPWQLVCCTVEAFPDPARVPAPASTRRYKQVLLFEEWMDAQQCAAFIGCVQNGEIEFGDAVIRRSGNASWHSEMSTGNSHLMAAMGFVTTIKFSEEINWQLPELLLEPTLPYYPDVDVAAGDWLPFPQYHGATDGRRWQVHFLLPEARAFFTSAISEGETLKLTLGGRNALSPDLRVKGIFWIGKHLEHFEGSVIAGQAEVPVPSDINRLEFALIDAAGEIYDVQHETWSSHSNILRQRSAHSVDAAIQQILAACETGENEEIEFKPFIDPNDEVGSVGSKTKFREVLRTIAAFANTGGGHVYFGVNDCCIPEGIQEQLRKWGRAEVSEPLIAAYRGVLIQKIRGEMLGPLQLQLTFAVISEALVGVLGVAANDGMLVGLRDEGNCYVRRGASNKYLQPHEWPRLLAGEISL